MQGSGQVNIFGDIAVVSLAVTQIRPPQFCRNRQHLSRLQIRIDHSPVVVEHQVQLRRFRTLHMQAGIVVVFGRRFHHTHLQCLLGSVPGFGIMQCVMPVQCVNRETDGSPQGNQKTAFNQPAMLPQAEQENRRRAENRGGGNAPLEGKKIICCKDCPRKRAGRR